MAFEQKPNSGALFVNKTKKTDSQPALRGSIHVDKVLLENLINQSNGALVEIAIAGWNQKSKAGDPYISLAASEPYKKQEQQAQSDDVPEWMR